MPHAGLMDEEDLGPERGALQRARLHLRGARRRLGQDKPALGLAALYDALTSGMDWFLASAGRRTAARLETLEHRDDVSTYAALVCAGVLDDGFDFPGFQRLVYRISDEAPSAVDHAALLRAAEAVLARLGVLPFDEATLPPEDPGTP